MGAGDAAAQDDDFGGGHAGDAPKKDAAPARRLLQGMRADLRREPSGDFRHRGQQRQAAKGRGYRLIGDAGRPGGDEIFGLGEIGREMQIGEEHLSRPKLLALGGERLLDLHHHFGAGKNLDGVFDDRRAGLDIFGVRKTRAYSRRRFDQNLMAVVNEFGDRRRRQTDAKLIVLDFLGNPDQHFRLPRMNAAIILVFPRNVPRFSGQIREAMADYAKKASKREILCESRKSTIATAPSCAN